MLDRIEIHNYKSLRRVRLDRLPPFAVMVGANASGKSNFADALHFLSLVFGTNLSAAVRAKGGYENLCFRRVRRSKLGLHFTITAQVTGAAPQSRGGVGKAGQEFICTYQFGFRATTQAIAAQYRVTEENLTVSTCDAGQSEPVLQFRRYPSLVFQGSNPPERSFGAWPSLEFIERMLKPTRVPDDELLIAATLSFFSPVSDLWDLMRACRIHQFWPQVARQTGVPERSPELGRSGENLPAALDYVQRSDPQAFAELVANLQHTVPTIEGLETQYVETKQLGLFFKERGVARRWFSLDMSDGTIQTVSLFLALADKRVKVLVIEEPENSLHPWILRHFMDVCREKSREKQIVITTQSPVAVNSVQPEALFLVRRVNGETSITRCSDIHPEAVDAVKANLLGLGDYWDSGAIGAVPSQQPGLFETEDL